MSEQEEYYNQLSTSFIQKHNGVEAGKMMSSPGMKFNNKVFAFFHKDRMCFRVGPDVDLTELGIKNIEPLSPFRTKRPLIGWYYVDFNDNEKWDMIAELALKFTRTL